LTRPEAKRVVGWVKVRDWLLLTAWFRQKVPVPLKRDSQPAFGGQTVPRPPDSLHRPILTPDHPPVLIHSSAALNLGGMTGQLSVSNAIPGIFVRDMVRNLLDRGWVICYTGKW
jgi:hypothetical protein